MENRTEMHILLAQLEKRLQKASAELAHCPPGQLHRCRERNKTVFKQVFFDEDGTRHRKTIVNHSETVMGLARKEYLNAELEILKIDTELIRKVLNDYIPPTSDAVLKALPSRFRSLPEEWFWHESAEVQLADKISKWAAAPYRQSDYKPEKRNKRTSRGLMVRSMGEVACVEQFYYHDIAFRYEQVLEIEGFCFSPDFTIMRRHDGKIFYWEHCGMPYDEDYMRHHRWKLEMYEKAGIVPWDNLIVTYSDIYANADVKLIESEIVNKLL